MRIITDDDWQRAPATPAVQSEWVSRLGGGAPAVLAVRGAIGRGELRPLGDGRLALTTRQQLELFA